MDEIISFLTAQLGGRVDSALVGLSVKAVLFVLAVCLLYFVIKGAVKSAISESRRELNYIIRKALLDEKADAKAGAKDIPDYSRQGF